MTELDTLLVNLGVCTPGKDWAHSQPDLQTAWLNCPNSDWMLVMVSWTTVPPDDPRLRLMARDFVDAVLHLVPEGEGYTHKMLGAAQKLAAEGNARLAATAARNGAARAQVWFVKSSYRRAP